jgi:beta-galactosidase/beta-glucuronidase
VEYRVDSGSEEQQIEMEVFYQGDKMGAFDDHVYLLPHKASGEIMLNDFQKGEGELWSPESPLLYDIILRLKDEAGRVVDEVKSYFGMRSISVNDGHIQLNHKPYYMKLVLDQGYFPEGLLTAPSDSDLKKDIELCKEMGFNGARKHQKVEDPRYLYWADRLGFLVWGEMANCHTYSDKAVGRMMKEWQEAVERDYNHPSIVAWVPLNESWGVPRIKSDFCQSQHSLSLYHLTKSLDPTRLVVANDGWELTKFDILSIHDYEGKKEVLKERYSDLDRVLDFKPSERTLLVSGFVYNGEPVFISEFGGIAYKINDQEGWGYTTASGTEDFIERYKQVISGLLESPTVQGFCYTQITDVEQEINGLLTYDRKPKVDLCRIKKINEGNGRNHIIKVGKACMNEMDCQYGGSI